MVDETEDGLRAALAALQPEIRQMLAEDLPVDLQRCRDAFAATRWGELREYVHHIKGTASFCKLEDLKQVCVRIEESLATDTPPPGSAMEELVLRVIGVMSALERQTAAGLSPGAE